MARDLITPLQVTAESSTPGSLYSSNAGVKMNNTNGIYIKTGGTSNIDATKLLFWVSRNSSACTAALMSVVKGSTDGNTDYEPGPYSTLNNLDLMIAASTQVLTSGSKFAQNWFYIPETAKYKDTDGYIKFNVSAAISSATHASRGALMGAIYLKDAH